jgi:hypothetical protein
VLCNNNEEAECDDGWAGCGSYLRVTDVGAKSGLVRSLPNEIQVSHAAIPMTKDDTSGCPGAGGTLWILLAISPAKFETMSRRMPLRIMDFSVRYVRSLKDETSFGSRSTEA